MNIVFRFTFQKGSLLREIAGMEFFVRAESSPRRMNQYKPHESTEGMNIFQQLINLNVLNPSGAGN